MASGTGVETRALAAVGLALLLPILAAWGPPAQDPRTDPPPNPPAADADPFAEPAPRDPDDAAFMPAPRNQLGTWSAGRTRPLTRGFDDDHWLMLTVVPTYAAIHVPFIGRGDQPLRGGGVALELDIRALRWLGFRVFASHTVHPVFDEASFDEDTGEVTQLANAGLVQVTGTGGSLVYALDIGRFVPRVDVGAGLLFVRSPDAAQPGQWGAECRDNGVCDLGLACNAASVCEAAPYPEFHAGIGVDVLLGRRWAIGLAVRYYALLSAISDLPIYLHGSLRASVRF